VAQVDFAHLDSFEVRVYQGLGGAELRAAIELVSPANKDRPENRDAFANKCAAYLQQGVGLVVVDVVTDRHSDWHGEVLKRLGWTTEENGQDADLTTAAYRPIKRDGQTSLDIWRENLKLASALVKMPLWLRGNLCMPVDLEATYDRTCRELQITT
jgi:hypothetical protein